jgi:peptidoglycan/xylan/chitin deacetylase (PgdA/CDA1 family)
MIGVLSKPHQRPIVTEFFELFKTPWEFAAPGRHYPVAIATTDDIEGLSADMMFVFNTQETSWDSKQGIRPGTVKRAAQFQWQSKAIPLFTGMSTFDPAKGTPCLTTENQDVVALALDDSDSKAIRLGYDLFEEVDFLLTEGQPSGWSMTPTLDLHIACLRSLILDAGQPITEVLPRPEGCDFICCLTHDIDFYGLRRHKFDRTLLGFLYRAIVKTPIDAAKGRRPARHIGTNWKAAASLPLVFGGMIPDPWEPFAGYQEIEQSHRATFFIIPQKNVASRHSSRRRAVAYEAKDIKPQMDALRSAGHEIGLHGLDAWCDPESAQRERDLLDRPQGIRMHWLYFDGESPVMLEQAGFSYDSTLGYNDAAGYRAGTSQPFCFPGTNLFELPLHIQDTALFYPGRMGLGEEEAEQVCSQITRHFVASAGVLTINWHDRSLAPERLWGDFYRRLLDSLSQNRVWFATASQAIDWFRQRRAIRFNRSTGEPECDERVGFSRPPVVRRYCAVARWSPEQPAISDRELPSSQPKKSPGVFCRHLILRWFRLATF